jgi:hypothetical protein
VLTLFERIDTGRWIFTWRCRITLPTTAFPVRSRWPISKAGAGELLAGKPAALLSCLPGVGRSKRRRQRIAALGEMLGRLHLAGAEMANPLPNPCGSAWRQRVGEALLPVLSRTSAVCWPMNWISGGAGLLRIAARHHSCRPLSRQRACGTTAVGCPACSTSISPAKMLAVRSGGCRQ